MADDSTSVDLLGVRPIAQAVNTVTTGTMSGAAAFLSRICLPAAEEFGQLLADKVRGWRANNAQSVLAKAQAKLQEQPDNEDRHAHPRIVGAILEHASWIDDDKIQSMWAGLLASACTLDGADQTNLIYTNILSQLTSEEVRILNYSCENAKVVKSPPGWIMPAAQINVSVDELKKIVGTSDIHRIDLFLDHCREIGVLHAHAGFQPMLPVADITPSALGLQLYVRGQGYVGSPSDYFGLN